MIQRTFLLWDLPGKSAHRCSQAGVYFFLLRLGDRGAWESDKKEIRSKLHNVVIFDSKCTLEPNNIVDFDSKCTLAPNFIACKLNEIFSLILCGIALTQSVEGFYNVFEFSQPEVLRGGYVNMETVLYCFYKIFLKKHA